MSHRRLATMSLPDPAYADILKLWTLRSLLLPGTSKEALGQRTCGLAGLLGLPEDTLEDMPAPRARATLQRLLDSLERQGLSPPTDTAIARNVLALGDRLGLTAVERDILHLTALQRLVPEFDTALENCGRLTRAGVIRLLAICVGHPVDAVRLALDDDSQLARSSLLWVDGNSAYAFGGKIEMLDGLSDDLTVEHDDLIALVRRSLIRGEAPSLSLSAYPHLVSGQ